MKEYKWGEWVEGREIGNTFCGWGIPAQDHDIYESLSHIRVTEQQQGKELQRGPTSLPVTDSVTFYIDFFF